MLVGYGGAVLIDAPPPPPQMHSSQYAAECIHCISIFVAEYCLVCDSRLISADPPGAVEKQSVINQH
jgi:hypothetical protein